MRILATSDLHSLPRAYETFARALRGYDLGIIAGDIIDEYISDQELEAMFGLDPDVFLDELPADGETADDMVKRWHASEASEYLARGQAVKEQELKAILGASGRPVLVVPGNHDMAQLSTEGRFINIHLRSVTIDGQAFARYGCLDRSLDTAHQLGRLAEVEALVDARTILVTHIAPTMAPGDDENGGCSAVLAQFAARSRPLFHVYGHAHSGWGIRGTSINAAYPQGRSFVGLDARRRRAWLVPTPDARRWWFFGWRVRRGNVVTTTPVPQERTATRGGTPGAPSPRAS